MSRRIDECPHCGCEDFARLGAQSMCVGCGWEPPPAGPQYVVNLYRWALIPKPSNAHALMAGAVETTRYGLEITELWGSKRGVLRRYRRTFPSGRVRETWAAQRRPLLEAKEVRDGGGSETEDAAHDPGEEPAAEPAGAGPGVTGGNGRPAGQDA